MVHALDVPERSSPPTRGCSVHRAAHRHPGRVLPADAGVFRLDLPRHRRRRRPPRRRGGVPPQRRPRCQLMWSSPPTRGCSGDRGVPGHDPVVLPADAGVFRGAGNVPGEGHGPPRRRGGVPPPPTSPAPPRSSSPPTRGCSGRRARADPHAAVLPADAGVFRRGPWGRRGRWCPPRRRGGVPTGTSSASTQITSSPPTRGCSAAPDGPDAAASVLPADAGVFRSLPWSSSTATGPPRRRGGVPRRGGRRRTWQRSSPPTRGCSAAALTRPCPSSVLPADAGVFRHTRPHGRPHRRPPRRRGGVPPLSVDRASRRTSSPPTRGCSAFSSACSATA